MLFCEIYVNGTAPYSGNAAKCYEEVFKTGGIRSRHQAKQLLKDPRIKAYIDELNEAAEEDNENIKRYLTQNLMRIIDETSSAKYYDRRGTSLSPAPLRSVAVTAAKALMDMYKVKEAATTNLSIEGAGEGGLTFNVIVPEIKTEADK